MLRKEQKDGTFPLTERIATAIREFFAAKKKTATAKAQVKIKDLKPKKEAKGGGTAGWNRVKNTPG